MGRPSKSSNARNPTYTKSTNNRDTSSKKSSKRKRESIAEDSNDNFSGFQVKIPKLNNKKAKIDESPGQAKKTIVDPFPDSTLRNWDHEVKPAKQWEALSQYRACKQKNVSFALGDMVFVNQQPGLKETHADALIKNWVAKILEIRGTRTAAGTDVYLRVSWAYRPEDLPGGRKWWRGTNELIVSNHMDIIEAVTVHDHAEVVYWDDDPNSPVPEDDPLFWRQSFDVIKKEGPRLSRLHTYCIDKTPNYPGDLLVRCPSCDLQMHAQCIKNKAKEDLQSESTKGKEKAGILDETIDADLHHQGDLLRLVLYDRRESSDAPPKDLDINCLNCNALVQSAEKGLSVPLESEESPKTPAAQTWNDDDEEEEEEEENPSNSIPPSSPPRPSTTTEINSFTDLATHSRSQIKSEAASAEQKENQPKRGRGRPPKTKKMVAATAAKSTTMGVQKAPVIAAPKSTATPAPVPVSEGILQSGMQSVKRLLFR